MVVPNLDAKINAFLATVKDKSNYCISDMGANTSIFGKGWMPIEYTLRAANIVGFHQKAARKHNLPIITAVTIVDLGMMRYLLKAHEVVLNEGSPIPLMSEFQVRDHGCIIGNTEQTGKGTMELSHSSQTLRSYPTQIEGSLGDIPNLRTNHARI